MDKTLRSTLKDYFKNEFAELIVKKLKSGHTLSAFTVNPFIAIALSSGVYGDLTPENMAKALLYPRVFGTSISTTFGDKMQKMCVKFLGARASSAPGMDIEFDDHVEKQTVLAQLKSGPNTINSGDVDPVVEDMKSAYRLIRQNRGENIPTFALVATYGTLEEISGHYKKIANSSVGGQDTIPIYIGQDFWHRLTGNQNFYSEMITLFIEVFEEENYTELLEQDVKNLTEEVKIKYFTEKKFDVNKV